MTIKQLSKVVEQVAKDHGVDLVGIEESADGVEVIINRDEENTIEFAKDLDSRNLRYDIDFDDSLQYFYVWVPKPQKRKANNTEFNS